MKNRIILFTLLFITFSIIQAQDTLFYEDFGSTSAYEGKASGYSDYYSSVIWPSVTMSDDSIIIDNYDPLSGYPGASGENFLLLGYNEYNHDIFYPKWQLSGINTTGHFSNRLSIGHLVLNETYVGNAEIFLKIYYSIDGSNWTLLNNELCHSGNWAPPPMWGYITLYDTLPQTTDLHIMIVDSSEKHAVKLDDILITGNPPDFTPPSKPGNLSSHKITPYSCILSWDASTDNLKVAYYEVFKNGLIVGSSKEPYYEIERQIPESNIDLSVIAYDVGGNMSLESDLLNISFPADTNSAGQQFLWNEDQAIILSNGDLEWAPKPFEYKPGSSIRYIDYENGDDNADGLSTSTAWKCHPWDPTSIGNAKACTGIHTYVFKCGVIYRGTLKAKESGTAMECIQLTSDPSWGTGKAMFYGSQRIEGGWTQCDTLSAPKIPNSDKVWYIDLNPSVPRTKIVAAIDGNQMKRIKLARSPNWEITDSIIPKKNWWKWTGVYNNATFKLGGYLIDSDNLTQNEVDYWKGATVWSEWNGTMGSVWGMKVEAFDPANNSITNLDEVTFGGNGNRYYLENLPQILDTTNEYWFDKDGLFPGRLYVRLDNEQNPNSAIIELANKERVIEINTQHHIKISGISFAFNTYDRIHYNNGDADYIPAIINTYGYCHHIEISNCKFTNVNAAISIDNTSSPSLNVNNIIISDNYIKHINDQAITFDDERGKFMDDIYILRNKIYQNGISQLCRWYSSIPAVRAHITTGVVAGNFIDYSWGAGLHILWGKTSDENSSLETPLVRGLTYHNRLENNLLGTHDWGSIAHWQCGPAYCYNNYAKSAPGWNGSENNSVWTPWGFPYYFDGAFKTYAFNNIAVSPYNSLSDPSQRNRSGYQMVIGMFDIIANNTSHNFYMGLIAQTHKGGTPCYNAYLGNLFNKTSHTYINQSRMPLEEVQYSSYANNIFAGTASIYWDYDGGKAYSFESFRQNLHENQAQSSQLGWEAEQEVISEAENNDFVPDISGEAIDRGVKFFAPFSLSKVVGEWHFTKLASDSSTIIGNNFYITDEYKDRSDYQNVPKNNLKAVYLTPNSYVKGVLEDWIDGALVFDGEKTFCYVEDSSLQQSKKCNNLNMTTNNFIIETYLKTEINHTGGKIVSKSRNSSNGYSLELDETGKVKVELVTGGGSSTVSLCSSIPINDSAWHHVLVEVNRTSGINIYIDGSLKNGALSGNLPEKSLTLENNEDFYIGKGVDSNFFAGTIDFIRISKGDLEDAKTTINELYKWQFDGPFLYDFAGNAPAGKRDAGALEGGEKSCDLSLTRTKLNFGVEGGEDTISIITSGGFEVIESQENYISSSLNGNVITISIAANSTTNERTGNVKVFGCNETISINIIQEAQPDKIEDQFQVIEIYPNPANNNLFINHNISGNIDLEFYNLNGSIIQSHAIINKQEIVNISNIPSGFYLLRVKYGNNEQVVKKLSIIK